MNDAYSLDTIVALCKRRGFVFPSAEIYGGLNGVYDFGPLGTTMRENIRTVWKKHILKDKNTIEFLEGALLGPQQMWEASGHLQNFSDPMVDCTNCKKRFRSDENDIDLTKPCKHCGVRAWTDIRQFQMMFKTDLGAVSESAHTAYLRPETAQAIFTNFKNILSTSRVKIPFGIAQIGKAFRNEITPKQFLFRMREFEQMELEFFCKESDSDHFFNYWVEQRRSFYDNIGLTSNRIRIRTHEKTELAHYSKNTADLEYQFPFGWKELEGIANRGTFDLSQHSAHSGKDLSVYDDTTKSSYIPAVIECSVGVDRLFLTLLFDAYHQEEIEDDTRVVLKLSSHIAPIQIAILPLSKQLDEPAEHMYLDLRRKGFRCQFDTSGSIGKRYRRQDEIGTPFCITYDFESKNDLKVTIRDRDTLLQDRIAIDQVESYLKNKFVN